MKTIQRIETFDGKVHNDAKAALKHLGVLHANALSSISHAICQLNGKYVTTGDWIDDNLDRFLALHTIKQDMILVAEDEED